MAHCRQALFMAMPYYVNDIIGKMFSNPAPTKQRPFLIIGEDAETLTTVTVTSEKLKKKCVPHLFKAGYYPLVRHHPPFQKPSLVKLTDYYVIEKFQELDDYLMHNGECLNENDFGEVLKKVEGRYYEQFSKEQIIECNSPKE